MPRKDDEIYLENAVKLVSRRKIKIRNPFNVINSSYKQCYRYNDNFLEHLKELDYEVIQKLKLRLKLIENITERRIKIAMFSIAIMALMLSLTGNDSRFFLFFAILLFLNMIYISYLNEKLDSIGLSIGQIEEVGLTKYDKSPRKPSLCFFSSASKLISSLRG